MHESYCRFQKTYVILNFCLLLILRRIEYSTACNVDGKMINQWWTDKDLEETGNVIIKVLSLHFPRGTGRVLVKQMEYSIWCLL
jgi:hypothetical protein